jgi:NodT family efflux transporter outer membrane factor (OMF) lipoprotein
MSLLPRPVSLLAALLPALALAGCAHNRWTERAPDVVAVPKRYAAETVDPLAAGSALEPAPEVCRDLGGESLRLLAVRLVADNLDLRAAAARLRQAQATAAEAGAPLLPRLDASLQGSRSSSSRALFGGGLGGGGGQPFPGGDAATDESVTFYQPSLAASYEVDLWGKLRDRKAAAALDALASAEALRALQVSLTAQLAETWTALLAERQLLDLLEQQLGTSEKFVELTRLRFGQGQGTAADLGRQQQQLEALRGELELARGRERTLLGQLGVLLGEAPDAVAPPDGRELPPFPPPPDPGLPLDLVTARPDLRGARLRLEAADRRLAAQAKDWLPSLNLSGSLFSFATSLGDVLDDVLWQVAARLSETVYAGGARAARIEGADARAEEALWVYGQTLLASLQEVRAALVGSASQAAFLASLDRQLVDAQRVLELVRDGYREGANPYLDVLTALLSQQQLERQRVAAYRQQFANRVQLCRALGYPVASSAETNPAGKRQDDTARNGR